MADVNFDCPFCGQNLEADEEMVGTNVPCPACGKVIRVVVPTTRPRGEPSPPPPPPPPPPMPAKEDMVATTRIELPPEALAPERKGRIITIKRLRR